MTCQRCGAELISLRSTRPYSEVGLSNVTLVDVEVRVCRRCRGREIVTPNVAMLHRRIARAIIVQRRPLPPDAIRFLRTWLGLSCDGLAQLMGVRRETVFRWERRDAASPMSPTADRLLRLLVANHDSTQRHPLTVLTAEPTAPTDISLRAPRWQRLARAAPPPMSE